MITAERTKAREKRVWLPKDFTLKNWEDLKPWFGELMEHPLETSEETHDWLVKLSELQAVIYEEMALAYIQMTRDTKNDVYAKHYNYIVGEILPKVQEAEHELNLKLYDAPGFTLLDPHQYLILKRHVRNVIRLFNEDNIQLEAKEKTISQEFGGIVGVLSVEHKGETLTLQQAAVFLENSDRAIRKLFWEKIQEQRIKSAPELQQLFSKLLNIRKEIASNADFDSYSDYKFLQLGRHDYHASDCEEFHASIEDVVTPFFEEQMEKRKEILGVDSLRPWDVHVPLSGEKPLKPFDSGSELIDNTVKVLNHIDPSLAEKIEIMEKGGFLDLESRPGKAPGGYNYGLAETGIPFVFMNAVGMHADLVTMLHESGHAVHSFQMASKKIHIFKDVPSEIAELAAMSMELISMSAWDLVYEDPNDLARAKKDKIRETLMILPWVASIDAFQNWVYDNPEHSEEVRNQEWVRIYHRFHGEVVNWEGYEKELENLWTKQGHVFEIPFYYIEYGIAQLGALAIWRNYNKDPEKALQDYMNMLKLGNTKTLQDTYAEAGIKFDFSKDYISELVKFVKEELDAIEVV